MSLFRVLRKAIQEDKTELGLSEEKVNFFFLLILGHAPALRGFTPGRLRGNLWDARDQNWVDQFCSSLPNDYF